MGSGKERWRTKREREIVYIGGNREEDGGATVKEREKRTRKEEKEGMETVAESGVLR